MKKSAIVLFVSSLLTLTVFAQNIQEGVNHLYSERNASAKATFEKMIASNPNNLEAIYWLGQTHLAQNNTAEAKALYEKTLAANGNAPLVLVGMGHVELLEGKAAEAKQRFETAISLSRGKKGDDPTVLNAIGRANVNVTNGDIPYAIAKLTQAGQLAPQNADIFINLGNAYRKAKDGGQAVANYIKALPTAPAIAYYRMARIYETQRNWDVFTEHLNKAIEKDPKFAPAYQSLYFYNLLYKQDFAKASELANTIVSVSDPSVENEYFKAQTSYLQKQYDQAIATANSIIAQAGAKANPRVYRLIAYSQLAKGDTAAAKAAVDQLFAKGKEEDIVVPDYTLKATIAAKTNPEQVVAIYMEGMGADTSFRNKVLILQEAIDWAEKNKMKVAEADLKYALYEINPDRNPATLISIGIPYYQGGHFEKANNMFQQYSKAFPDSVYGYLWSARALGRLDSTMAKGLAIPQYEQLLRVAEMDKERLKAFGLEAVGNLAQYYVNVKSDREKGVFYLKKGLEFDPANESFKTYIDRLTKTSAPKSPGKPAGSAVKKPASTTK